MERIHKIIVIVFAALLCVILVAGIIFSSANGRDEKLEIKENPNYTTTTPSTTTAHTTASSGYGTTSSDTPSFTAKDMSVKVGKTAQIKVESTKYYHDTSITVSPQSTNEAVATVTSKGIVTGVEIGECNIIITGSNGESVTIKVTVTDDYGTTPVEEKTVYSTGCNFRAGPGLDYDIITFLDEGTELTVFGVSGEWYKAKMGDQTGFVGITVVTEENSDGDDAGDDDENDENSADNSITDVITTTRNNTASPVVTTTAKKNSADRTTAVTTTPTQTTTAKQVTTTKKTDVTPQVTTTPVDSTAPEATTTVPPDSSEENPVESSEPDVSDSAENLSEDE